MAAGVTNYNNVSSDGYADSVQGGHRTGERIQLAPSPQLEIYSTGVHLRRPVAAVGDGRIRKGSEMITPGSMDTLSTESR